jgi:uncharacterized protein YgbK (DUF1537 family)
MLLGCIADDLTGATDLADTLVRSGMATALVVGVPRGALPHSDAVVMALKTRTAPPEAAVVDSRAALARLRAKGARQIVLKYCSTFDSTEAGNIGPVVDALLDDLGSPFTIACPAYPANGRAVFRGHLFVGDRLLSESGMRDHPLTPMTDPDLVRVLARQARGPVGRVDYDIVSQGAEAIGAAFQALAKGGVRYAIVDAIEDRHLDDIGMACADLALVTGGSGVARGLPANFRRRGELGAAEEAGLPVVGGHAAVLAGSCSPATLTQIAAFAAKHPAIKLDALALAADAGLAQRAAQAAIDRLPRGPVLVYASAAPEEVARVQGALGRAAAGHLVEQALAEIAACLVGAGVRRLVIAGGETSGTAIARLGIVALRVGPRVDPGVPWMVAEGASPLLLALKAGNFGAPDVFARALGMAR